MIFPIEDIPAYRGLPVIVGSGVAGMVAALSLNRPCVLCASATLGGDTSSALAQGGIAAVLSAHDSVKNHVVDTLRAGVDLCDEKAVQTIIGQGRDAVAYLQSCGVLFDEDGTGALDLHLEAAHSRPRIAHVRGDSSGASIVEALSRKIRQTPSIYVLEYTLVERLLVTENVLYGLVGFYHEAGKNIRFSIKTPHVILAGGGMGALYEKTTNPASVAGHALIMAAQAGAELADLEFIQFHPTAFSPDFSKDMTNEVSFRSDKSLSRLSLISEAVRGAGAILVDETHVRFTDELQPRDVVTRAIWAHLQQGHKVFLDATHLVAPAVDIRFPSITQICRAYGVDPLLVPIPVTPAAHYTMGGIRTDLWGRTSVKGLWAAGECASTGLHGANRLASNSLLETVVMGRRAAHDVETSDILQSFNGLPDVINHDTRGHSSETSTNIAQIMSRYVGIVRNEDGLKKAIIALFPLIENNSRALLATLVAYAALKRTESRGAHFREDYPIIYSQPRRSFITLTSVWPELEKIAYS